MLKLILLLSFIIITPLAASGYEYYETNPYNTISADPTVCYISFEYIQEYEDITKQAITNWQYSLQQYTNNPDKWNIYYSFIQNDYEDDVRANIDSLGCDIFVDFTDTITPDYDGTTHETSNGTTGRLVTGHTVIEISTSNGLSQEQLVSTTTHEIGHAFRLGHYITNEDELLQQWDQGIDIPSIMIEDAVSVGVEQITDLDLKKMVTLYGTDGFEELPQTIPEWIQTIFVYYGDGSINDSELINAIQYLAENGIIQIN